VKNILFVESYPHVVFGQQKTLLSLLDLASVVDIEPVVALTNDGPFVDEVSHRNLSPIYYRYPDLISGYGGAIYRTKGLRWLNMMWQVAGYIWNIRRQLKQKSFDAIFCNDMRGLLTVGVAARSLGIPVMIWDKLDKPHGWMDWIQLPLVTRNLIISDSVRTKYPLWQQKIFKKKIIKVYNGADLSRFDSAVSIRDELIGGNKDILIGIVGTITERKGQDRIFKVWKQLIDECPDLRLLVVGETSGNSEDDDYLASLPNKNNPRINFLGMRTDVPNIMKSIDMLIVPSRFEGMGQVTVEAMASGLPVIGANTGGIPEVVLDGETGIIIDGDSEQEMIDAVLHMARSPELRKKMGVAGRTRAEKYFNRPKQMQKVLQQLVEMS
jgi:glycosyltransferase involved in cell wall biosynthesis